MRCKVPYINVINVAPTAVEALGSIKFNQVMVKGTCIGFVPGSDTVVLPHPGVYDISFDADIEGDAAEPLAVQIYNNGIPILGAVATNTMVLTRLVHFHLQAAIPVRKSCECINNTARITVVISAAGTVSNANLIIHKIA